MSNGNRKKRQTVECGVRIDPEIGAIQAGDQGFMGSGRCSDCCAWCREGFVFGSTLLTTDLFGIDANGQFDITVC